jgi:hypothetical protein
MSHTTRGWVFRGPMVSLLKSLVNTYLDGILSTIVSFSETPSSLLSSIGEDGCMCRMLLTVCYSTVLRIAAQPRLGNLLTCVAAISKRPQLVSLSP